MGGSSAHTLRSPQGYAYPPDLNKPYAASYDAYSAVPMVKIQKGTKSKSYHKKNQHTPRSFAPPQFEPKQVTKGTNKKTRKMKVSFQGRPVIAYEKQFV